MAFFILNGAMALLLYVMNKRENRRRDEKYGPAPLPDEVQEYEDPAYQQKWGLEGMTRAEIVELGDDHPAFRYWLQRLGKNFRMIMTGKSRKIVGKFVYIYGALLSQEEKKKGNIIGFLEV